MIAKLLSAYPTLLILTALLMAPCLSEAGNWPQYRGPNLDGSTADTVENTDWSDGLKELWKVPTPLGFSSFAAADGKAFTLISRRDADGVDRETCVALDAETGKEIWAAPLGFAKYDGGGDSGEDGNKGGDGPRSTPSVDGDRVFVFDAQLTLYCFDAADGSPIWKRDLEEDYEGRNIRWQGAASPVVDGGLVYVMGGGEGQSFLAFESENGELAWKSGDEIMTHATPVASTIHGVRQIVFFTKFGLVSVDAKTGRELWRFEHPYKISTAASPIVDGDHVYLSVGYGIGAAVCKIVKTDDGFSAEKVWRKKNKLPNHWSTPVLKDGYLYGMFSFKDYGTGPMKCVELVTGEVMWSHDGFGPGNCILIGNDQVLALSDRGELVLVEATPDEYKEVARAKVLDGKCWSTPILSDGRVYARSVKEGVCLDVSSAK